MEATEAGGAMKSVKRFTAWLKPTRPSATSVSKRLNPTNEARPAEKRPGFVGLYGNLE
jgi:hypothetical protein